MKRKLSMMWRPDSRRSLRLLRGMPASQKSKWHKPAEWQVFSRGLSYLLDKRLLLFTWRGPSQKPFFFPSNDELLPWKAWAGNAPAASLGSEQKATIKLGPSAVLYHDVPAR